jgi:hypothetical protein
MADVDWYITGNQEVFSIYENGIFTVNCNKDLVYVYYKVLNPLDPDNDDSLDAISFDETVTTDPGTGAINGRTIEYQKCATPTAPDSADSPDCNLVTVPFDEMNTIRVVATADPIDTSMTDLEASFTMTFTSPCDKATHTITDAQPAAPK